MRCFVWALIFASFLPIRAELIPKMNTKALDGTVVKLPDPARPKPLLILLSFSRDSTADLEQWSILCTHRYRSDSRLRYAYLVDMKGIPFFVKPIVLRALRKNIPRQEQSLIVPFDREDKLWKKAAHLRDSKYQHLVLTDSAGNIVWREVGPASQAKCKALDARIAALGKQH